MNEASQGDPAAPAQTLCGQAPFTPEVKAVWAEGVYSSPAGRGLIWIWFQSLLSQILSALAPDLELLRGPSLLLSLLMLGTYLVQQVLLI